MHTRCMHSCQIIARKTSLHPVSHEIRSVMNPGFLNHAGTYNHIAPALASIPRRDLQTPRAETHNHIAPILATYPAGSHKHPRESQTPAPRLTSRCRHFATIPRPALANFSIMTRVHINKGLHKPSFTSRRSLIKSASHALWDHNRCFRKPKPRARDRPMPRYSADTDRYQSRTETRVSGTKDETMLAAGSDGH